MCGSYLLGEISDELKNMKTVLKVLDVVAALVQDHRENLEQWWLHRGQHRGDGGLRAVAVAYGTDDGLNCVQALVRGDGQLVILLVLAVPLRRRIPGGGGWWWLGRLVG